MKTIAQQLNIKEFPFIINDSHGNEIYYEDSNGYWCKYEYDSQGNEIYYETSDGFWSKKEYNSNGYITYLEYSTGYWYKKEHDSNGYLIYHEDSNGDIIDKRPKPSCEGKTVDIDGVKYKLVKE
jgi:hypothetical protein